MNQGWPIPEEVRPKLTEDLIEAVKRLEIGSRPWIAATKCLLAMNGQNIDILKMLQQQSESDGEKKQIDWDALYEEPQPIDVVEKALSKPRVVDIE